MQNCIDIQQIENNKMYYILYLFLDIIPYTKDRYIPTRG